MTEQFQPHTEIIRDDDGRRVASAHIEMVEQRPRASLSVDSGHVPAGTRERLVDAVLDSPEVGATHELTAAIPIGDAAVLDRIRERCDHTETRAAGASCLVEATMESTATEPGHLPPVIT